MRTPEGRVDAFKSLLPAVQKITDKLERAAVADDLAAYLGLERGLVLDQLKRAVTDRRAAESRPQLSAQVPAIERILLSAFFGSDRARHEILPLLTPQMIAGFSTRDIFEALRHTTDLEGPAAFAAVESRLTGPAQNLLHEVVTADEVSDEEAHWQQAQACLRRLEGGARKKQVDELKARVKTAEREGRVTEALKWMVELHRLETAQRAAGSAVRE
jgi:DNA primase